ncbi:MULTISPECIES: DUF4402 domain-containing protein [Pseudoalteromonas]|uniref:DUF4402 domain-containing protein n=1 Tax=Pseudoalteromonas TaxID=53246 RepID=UPI0018CFBFC1|nr:DUF4402 domain-containing protein [Pseudoalteromonas sp. NSLLW24]MBG9997762.1 DUF4402 domain-containing protein [Pseudoalteromonas sp. NSLLW24]
MKNYILIFSALFCTSAYSQITMIEPLDFGTIVVVKNEPGSSITVQKNGSSSGVNVHIIKRGAPAELLFENFGARVQIYITDSGNYQKLSRINGGTQFTLDSLIYTNSITTNAYGMAVLAIGGKLVLSGDGESYLDDRYSTTIDITISY